jgi:ABC-2 type transport system ATP-binding protein
MAAIQLDDLHKQYGAVTALDGVDLTVEEGEIFGFLGPNGAGKSTTINVLLDFVRPTGGTARVFGMNAQEHSSEVRQRTGVLPEGYHVYDRLTARQHVEFASESKGVAEDPVAVLERAGIGDAVDRKAGDFSKGMKQRLTLAMALVGDPDLLILDEPSTGLDPAGAREMRDIATAERDRGATVFFSSHILSQVEAVCDRVGILQNGELVAVDSVDQLREARGADATLEVTVDAITDEALDAVRALDGVRSVQADDSMLTVLVDDETKIDVLYALEENGSTVTDFSTTETSLEELFLSYTEGSR